MKSTPQGHTIRIGPDVQSVDVIAEKLRECVPDTWKQCYTKHIDCTGNYRGFKAVATTFCAAIVETRIHLRDRKLVSNGSLIASLRYWCSLILLLAFTVFYGCSRTVSITVSGPRGARIISFPPARDGKCCEHSEGASVTQQQLHILQHSPQASTMETEAMKALGKDIKEFWLNHWPAGMYVEEGDDALFDKEGAPVLADALPADMLERDHAAPCGSLYGSHTGWLAIREIHLSKLEATAFEGREMPTISEETAHA